jgi:hypothetical protein
MRRAGATLLIAVGIGALAAGLASAGVSEFPTVFDKFKYTDDRGSKPQFSGKIASPEDRCVKRRDAKLFRKKDGDRKKVGSDSTDGDGKFKFRLSDGPPKSGKYFAEADQKRFGDGEDRTICREGKSGKIEIS